jgi:hypothetical protein
MPLKIPGFGAEPQCSCTTKSIFLDFLDFDDILGSSNFPVHAYIQQTACFCATVSSMPAAPTVALVVTSKATVISGVIRAALSLMLLMPA